MTVSSCFKENLFICFVKGITVIGGRRLPLTNVLKEESIHWKIFVMLFM